VPSSADILEGLATTANDWRGVAIVWHVFLGTLLLSLVSGWRPSRRLAGLLLATPAASVSALSWASGNPFNGTAFTALSLVLAAIAIGLPVRPARLGARPLLVPGILLVGFGWAYPHFLQTNGWTSYLYAAPLGLLPCPTLSSIIGVSLIVDLLGSRLWGLVLTAVGVAYGLIGAFQLGVGIDLVLLAGALWTGVAAIDTRISSNSPLPRR
jgi:hypothetical protein